MLGGWGCCANSGTARDGVDRILCCFRGAAVAIGGKRMEMKDGDTFCISSFMGLTGRCIYIGSTIGGCWIDAAFVAIEMLWFPVPT